MKKIGIYLCSLLALSLATSCQEEPGRGIAQENPQGPVMSAEGVSIKYGSATEGESIDLNANQGKNLDVMSYTVSEEANFPKDAKVRFDMQVAADEAFTNAYTIPVVDGHIAADEWNAAFTKFFGLNPTARENYIRFVGYMTDGDNSYRIGNENTFFGAKKMNVTPVDANLPVENAYYLSLGGNEVKLSHSDKHPYDDPTFTLIIDVTAEQAAAGLEWYIVPESQIGKGTSGCFGVSETGDAADRSGSLSTFANGGVKGVISVAGTQMIKVNMLNLTYNISFAFPYIYTPGPANGWGFENNMLLFTDNYVDYHGFVYVDSMFKMTGQADWSPLDWGGDADGNMIPGGSNIERETGLYWVTANIAEMRYTTTAITGIGMIGGFNGWGGDVEMTPSSDFKTWKGTLTTEDATEFKFRCNGGWDINLGGTESNLVPNGGNLSVEAGTYDVELNIGAVPYTCKITKK